MNKTIYSRQSECLRKKLIEMREGAGLTQRQLAVKLHREHSLISRLELGERRLDVVELFWMSKACGLKPDLVASDLMKELEKIP